MDTQDNEDKFENVTIGGKYTLKELLGSGSFGKIYQATQHSSDTLVAIKLEKRIPRCQLTLPRESRVMSDMDGHLGFAHLYEFGKNDKYIYAVISLLSNDLEKHFKLCHKIFSLKTVLMLADQMLTRIEALHAKNYLHRDLKPENFCMGPKGHEEVLYIIDFGLVRQYRDKDLKHIAYKENKGLIGTARYASVNAHLGIEQSRRDDLESIGYILIYFMKGKLPWQNVRTAKKQDKYQLIADLKSKIQVELLCKGLPGQFAEYLSYVKGLGFTDQPNYAHLKKLFKQIFVNNNYDFDYEYDWSQFLHSNYTRNRKIKNDFTENLAITTSRLRLSTKVITKDNIQYDMHRLEFITPSEINPTNSLEKEGCRDLQAKPSMSSHNLQSIYLTKVKPEIKISNFEKKNQPQQEKEQYIERSQKRPVYNTLLDNGNFLHPKSFRLSTNEDQKQNGKPQNYSYSLTKSIEASEYTNPSSKAVRLSVSRFYQDSVFNVDDDENEEIPGETDGNFIMTKKLVMSSPKSLRDIVNKSVAELQSPSLEISKKDYIITTWPELKSASTVRSVISNLKKNEGKII